MYAIIKIGGHQEKVQSGDIVVCNRIEAKEGDKIELPVVLIVDDKNKITTDSKKLAKAKVTAEVVRDDEKGKKIDVLRFKNKTRQIKRRGHRQLLTRVKILEIELTATKAKATTTKEKVAE
jgi:large subunit ribosomal protein L21